MSRTACRTMPRQNRVDPFGALFAAPARGTLMGNRGGRLHRDGETLGPRRWAGRRWICCVTAFRGRRRTVWGAGYTELFFLDEPTALAAGHRPCGECRHAAFRAFLQAAGHPDADAADWALHAERLEGRRQRRWRAAWRDLPDGAVFALGTDALARREGTTLAWSPGGWRPAAPPAEAEADVLTPPTTVRALRAGYRPLWA